MSNKRSKVSPVLAAYAESLRIEGKTYAEIVSLCSTVGVGVTVNWCKRNLNNVEVAFVSDEKQKEAACIEEITRLAKQPKGVTPGEAYAVIRRIYGLFGSIDGDEDKEQKEVLDKLYKSIKGKVGRANTDALFRPASVNPYKAIESKKALFELSHEVYEFVESMLESYKHQIFGGAEDEWHRNSTVHELLTLACPSLHLQGGVLTRSEYLESVCDKLGERLLHMPRRVVDSVGFIA